jgi:hypothetical protein
VFDSSSNEYYIAYDGVEQSVRDDGQYNERRRQPPRSGHHRHASTRRSSTLLAKHCWQLAIASHAGSGGSGAGVGAGVHSSCVAAHVSAVVGVSGSHCIDDAHHTHALPSSRGGASLQRRQSCATLAHGCSRGVVIVIDVVGIGVVVGSVVVVVVVVVVVMSFGPNNSSQTHSCPNRSPYSAKIFFSVSILNH